MVRAGEQRGDAEGKRRHLTEYDVLPLQYEVKNLVIEQGSIKTNAGEYGEDYIQYDPDSENQKNRESTMSFKVIGTENVGSQYSYCIFMQPTGASGFEYLDSESTRWVRDVFNLNGSSATVDIPWDKLAQSDAFSEGWGTYTFDIGLIERDADGNIIDTFYYKWPYCLTIPPADHAVWWDISEGDNAKLRYCYIIRDYAKENQFLNFDNPSWVKQFPIDPYLSEQSSEEQVGNQIDQLYFGDDNNGILSYTISNNLPIEDGWRIIFLAEDQCWIKYRRDHQPVRMLAVNARPVYNLDLTVNASDGIIGETQYTIKAHLVNHIVSYGIYPHDDPISHAKIEFRVRWPRNCATAVGAIEYRQNNSHISKDMRRFAYDYTNSQGYAYAHYVAYPRNTIIPHKGKNLNDKNTFLASWTHTASSNKGAIITVRDK